MELKPTAKMKFCFIQLSILLLTIVFSGTALAVTGVVVYKKSGCDYFVVQSNMGYDLLEWYGGHDADEGDKIVGDFESYGLKDVFDVTYNDELRVYVEEYWLSKERVLEEYLEHCH